VTIGYNPTRENGECGRWLGEDYFTHNAGGYDFRRDAGARCGQAGPGLGRSVASCHSSSVSFQIQSHEKTPFGLRRRCDRTPGQLLARGLGGQGWLLHRALRRGGRGHRRRAPGGGPALPLPGLPGGARGLVVGWFINVSQSAALGHARPTVAPARGRRRKIRTRSPHWAIFL
jgi:hypothetical protein